VVRARENVTVHLALGEVRAAVDAAPVEHTRLATLRSEDDESLAEERCLDWLLEVLSSGDRKPATAKGQEDLVTRRALSGDHVPPHHNSTAPRLTGPPT
jgi:hypothetical protein